MSVPFLSQHQIEQIAIKVRSTFEYKDEYSLDITSLARKMGLEVFEAHFNTDEVTGKIEGKKIYVNANDSEPRKRFTIAHEIAHYLLHRNGEVEHVDYRRPREYYSEDDLKKEFQANMLAASLLMPESLVVRTWKETQDVDTLATLFRVSKKAAAIRLDALGLLE